MQFRPEVIDIKQLIQQNFEQLNVNALQKNIEIIVDSETAHYALADQTMMNLILRNLISNAIKFTYHGGKK